MNIIVVYDSEFGNTEQIARIITETLRTSHTVKLYNASEVDRTALTGVELLVVGGPTQRHTFSPAMEDWLESLPAHSLRGAAGAVFDTRYRMSQMLTGSAAHSIAKRLGKAGVSMVVPRESFFVVERQGPLEEGELERAARWAETVAAACVAKERQATNQTA